MVWMQTNAPLFPAVTKMKYSAVLSVIYRVFVMYLLYVVYKIAYCAYRDLYCCGALSKASNTEFHSRIGPAVERNYFLGTGL